MDDDDDETGVEIYDKGLPWYRRSNSKQNKVPGREQQTRNIPLHVETTG